MAGRKPKKMDGLRFRNGKWFIQKQIEGRRYTQDTGCRKNELGKAQKILQQFIKDKIAELEGRKQVIIRDRNSQRSNKSKTTYGAVAEEYLNSAVHVTVSDDYYVHNNLIRNIKGLTKEPLQNINRNHIKDFLQTLKKRGRSTRTINGYIKFVNKLKKLASTCYQSNEGIPYIEHPNLLPTYCKKNAHLYGIGFKNDERQPIILNDDQLGLMFSSFKNPEYSDLIMFLLMTGARAGEVLGLRWDEEAQKDINGMELQPKLRGRVFKIGDRVGDNKGNGRRYLFLNNTAKEILERQRGKDSEFVFVFSASQSHPKRHLGKHSQSRQEYYGTEVTARNARLTKYRDWKNAQKALGLQIVIKDLRSTFGTRLRHHDVGLYDEKDCLGHIVKDVTRRYAQASWLKLVGILNGIFTSDPRRSHLKIVSENQGVANF